MAAGGTSDRDADAGRAEGDERARPLASGGRSCVGENRQDELGRRVLTAGGRLPVASIGAVKNLGTIPEEEVSAELLYQTAGHDPVLTGDLLRVVNSWACPNLRRRISSLREAIFHLGTSSARTVLLAAATRKVYASKAILGLWKHSVEVAAYARRMGELAGCDPEAAFLSGLVHDVGRLAIEMLDADTLAIRSRLSEPGIPVVWVDLVTCRHDHAEIGGALLWRWNFPRSVVDAVALHHSPERSALTSKLAAILYLAEVRSGAFEDEPSRVKFEFGLEDSWIERASSSGPWNRSSCSPRFWLA